MFKFESVAVAVSLTDERNVAAEETESVAVTVSTIGALNVLDATVLSDLAAIDQIMFSFLPFIVISGLIITVSYVAKLEGKITGAAKY